MYRKCHQKGFQSAKIKSRFSCEFNFGVMLFEILGRRRHYTNDKIWFPKVLSEMWEKQPDTVMQYCGIMEEDTEKAVTVLMVAMWCAQYTPTLRPSMSDVVRVLEKKMPVTTPPYPFWSHNPFSSSMLASLQGIPVDGKSSAELEDDISKEYSRKNLEEFTSGFSNFNIIGTGIFGKVYRGKSPEGVEVAIKVFGHDFDIVQETFMTEG